MPETVELLENEDIILVTSTGKVTIEEWNRSLARMLEINENSGTNCVLVDVRGQLSGPDIYEIFNFGKRLPRQLKIAVIASKSTLRNQKFFETVGLNRGKRVQIFRDYDESIKWLQTKS